MAPCVSKTASCKLCVNVHFKSIIIKLQVVEFNLIKQLHKSTFKTFYYYLYRYNLIVCLFLLTLSALFCIINIDSVLHDLCKNYIMLRKFFFWSVTPCDHVVWPMTMSPVSMSMVQSRVATKILRRFLVSQWFIYNQIVVKFFALTFF